MTAFTPVFFEKNFEDPEVLSRLEAILKDKRGYNFKMPLKNSPVILVVSGGLDSITLWFQLLNKYKLQVYPIHFLTPHSVLGERLSVNFFYNYFKKRFPELTRPVKFIKLHFNFSFINPGNRQIFNNNFPLLVKNLFYNKKTREKKVFVRNYPVRWASYMTAAYEYGLELQVKKIPVHTIFTGTMPNDALVSRESTLTVLKAVNVFLCSIFGDWDWQITAPVEKKHKFFYWKQDFIKIGHKNSIPLGKTWSCGDYRYIFRQCGLCPTCRLRQWNFKEAGIKDKTSYFISSNTHGFLKKIALKLFPLFNQKVLKKHEKGKKNNLLKSPITMSAHVVQYWNKDTSYLFNKKTGEMVKVNPTGQSIINMIRKNPNKILAESLEEMQTNYTYSKEIQFQKDAAIFLKELSTKGFISVPAQ